MYMTNAQFKALEDAINAVPANLMDEDGQKKIAMAYYTLDQLRKRKQERNKDTAERISRKRADDPTYGRTIAYIEQRENAATYTKLDKRYVAVGNHPRSLRYVYSKDGKLYTRVFSEFYEIALKGNTYFTLEDF